MKKKNSLIFLEAFRLGTFSDYFKTDFDFQTNEMSHITTLNIFQHFLLIRKDK